MANRMRETMSKRVDKIARNITAKVRRGDYVILKKVNGDYNAGIYGGKGIGTFRTQQRAEEHIAKDMFDALGGDALDFGMLRADPKVWMIEEQIVEGKPENITKEWHKRNDWYKEEGYFASVRAASDFTPKRLLSDFEKSIKENETFIRGIDDEGESIYDFQKTDKPVLKKVLKLIADGDYEKALDYADRQDTAVREMIPSKVWEFLYDMKRMTERYASVRTAGWWGSGPIDGDTPLDIMGDVSDERTPEAAAKRLKRHLKDNNISTLYGALGVWDVFVSKAPDSYKAEFESLTSEVKSAAKKLLKLDYREEEENGQGWLGEDWRDFVNKYYARGVPSGKLRWKLRLKVLDLWYIVDVRSEYNHGESIEFEVELANDYEDENRMETVWIEIDQLEMIDLEEGMTPIGIENANVEIAIGGPSQKRGQQSILVTCDVEVETEDGDFDTTVGDIQLDLDQDTGEFDL